jgi:hypothetical protein
VRGGGGARRARGAGDDGALEPPGHDAGSRIPPGGVAVKVEGEGAIAARVPARAVMGAPGCEVVVMRNRMYVYRPDYAVPPGEKISETLGFCGLTLSDVTARIGWQERVPAEVTDEEAAVSPELACELEKAASAR